MSKICFVFVSIFISFYAGYQFSKHEGLDKCKKAGWEFIEQNVFPKSLLETSLLGKEYAIKRLNSLQSKAATECIVRFKGSHE